MVSISATSLAKRWRSAASFKDSTRRANRVRGVRRSCDTAATNWSRSSSWARMRCCIWLNTWVASRHSRVPLSGNGGRWMLWPSSRAAPARRRTGSDSQRAPIHAANKRAESRTPMSSSNSKGGGPWGGSGKPGGGMPGGKSGRSSNNMVSASTWLLITATASSTAKRPNKLSGKQRSAPEASRARQVCSRLTPAMPSALGPTAH